MKNNKLFLFLTTVFFGFSMIGYTAAAGGAGGDARAASLHDAKNAIIDTIHRTALDFRTTGEAAMDTTESSLLSFKAAYDAAYLSNPRLATHEVNELIKSVASIIGTSTEYTKNEMRLKVLDFLSHNFAREGFDFTPLKDVLPHIKSRAVKIATEELLSSVH